MSKFDQNQHVLSVAADPEIDTGNKTVILRGFNTMPIRPCSFVMLAAVSLTALATSVQANDVYFGARLGVIDPLASMHEMGVDTFEVTYDSSFFGGVYVGTFLGSGLRGELAVDAMRFNPASAVDDGGVPATLFGGTDAVVVTASLWRDLPAIGLVTPYIGLGAGFAWTSTDVLMDEGGTRNPESFRGNDLSPVGQVGAGVRFDVGERLTVDLGYRFLSIFNARHEQVILPPDLSDPSFGFGHYTTHQFSAGLAYRFGETAPEMASALDGPIYLGGYFGGAWTAETHIAADYGEGTSTVFDNAEGSFGFVAGAEIAPGLRGELELGFVRSSVDRVRPNQIGDPDQPYVGRFDQTFLLANLWKDFNHGPLTVYTGGGLGFALVDYDITDFPQSGSLLPDYDGSDGVFAGQFGAGIRYAATPNVTLDLGYRLKGAFGAVLIGEDRRDENARVSLLSHIVQGGFTYTFGASAGEPMPVQTDYGAYLSVAAGTGFNAVGELYEETGHPFYFESPLSLSLAYGQRLTDYLRAEVELSALHLDGDKTRDDKVNDPLEPVIGDVTQLSVLTNLWVDFDAGFAQPYVGGGLGMALINGAFNGEGATNELFSADMHPAFALQAGFGVRTAITDNILLDIGYRYRTAIDAFLTDNNTTGQDPGTVAFETHGLQLGLTYEFGN